jgi:hypothetical protein
MSTYVPPSLDDMEKEPAAATESSKAPLLEREGAIQRQARYLQRPEYTLVTAAPQNGAKIGQLLQALPRQHPQLQPCNTAM